MSLTKGVKGSSKESSKTLKIIEQDAGRYSMLMDWQNSVVKMTTLLKLFNIDNAI